MYESRMGRFSMSQKQINRSPDLQRLQDEGYEVEVRNGFLMLYSVPYLNSRREVAMGTLVSDVSLNDDRTLKPGDHQVWFAGDHPCKQDGTPISALGSRDEHKTLFEGIVVNRRFSCKPKGGYPDYYQKMTRYVEIISSQACAIDPKATACTYKPIETSEEDSVFLYTDSASSRAGIASLTKKPAMNRVAFVGLGGSGSYGLDMVAKTHVREIHLFDGDRFIQHNAFRSPGAASLEVLRKAPSKVAYYADIYRKMRRGVIPHEVYLDEETIQQLENFDFVFLCVDNPVVRKLVSDFLYKHKTPFIDVGMDIQLLEDEQCLYGTCRTTLSTPEKSDHFPQYVSLKGAPEEGLYGSNIQVAELNALNAAMAVIKWKKYCGFYQDLYNEHNSDYVINVQQLTREETVDKIQT